MTTIGSASWRPFRWMVGTGVGSEIRQPLGYADRRRAWLLSQILTPLHDAPSSTSTSIGCRNWLIRWRGGIKQYHVTSDPAPARMSEGNAYRIAFIRSL